MYPETTSNDKITHPGGFKVGSRVRLEHGTLVYVIGRIDSGRATLIRTDRNETPISASLDYLVLVDDQLEDKKDALLGNKALPENKIKIGDQVHYKHIKPSDIFMVIGVHENYVWITGEGYEPRTASADQLVKIRTYPEAWANVYQHGVGRMHTSQADADKVRADVDVAIGVLHLLPDGTTEMLEP